MLDHAVKVTKKELKITVKQWSVSFLVYRGRFAPLFCVFFDTTNFRRMKESENRQSQVQRIGTFSRVLNFV